MDEEDLEAEMATWVLEEAEEEEAAEKAVVTAATTASSRNCRRQRDDTGDQPRQGGEQQVNSFADFNFDQF